MLFDFRGWRNWLTVIYFCDRTPLSCTLFPLDGFELSPVPELSFLPALYRGWTRAGEKKRLFFCLPGFSPYMRREERRVQGLDYFELGSLDRLLSSFLGSQSSFGTLFMVFFYIFLLSKGDGWSPYRLFFPMICNNLRYTKKPCLYAFHFCSNSQQQRIKPSLLSHMNSSLDMVC